MTELGPNPYQRQFLKSVGKDPDDPHYQNMDRDALSTFIPISVDAAAERHLLGSFGQALWIVDHLVNKDVDSANRLLKEYRTRASEEIRPGLALETLCRLQAFGLIKDLHHHKLNTLDTDDLTQIQQKFRNITGYKEFDEEDFAIIDASLKNIGTSI